MKHPRILFPDEAYTMLAPLSLAARDLDHVTRTVKDACRQMAKQAITDTPTLRFDNADDAADALAYLEDNLRHALAQIGSVREALEDKARYAERHRAYEAKRAAPITGEKVTDELWASLRAHFAA